MFIDYNFIINIKDYCYYDAPFNDYKETLKTATYKKGLATAKNKKSKKDKISKRARINKQK